MGQEFRAAQLYLASNDYYRRALQANKTKADPSATETIMTQMGLNYLAVKDGKQASETLEKCLRQFPNSPRGAEWTLDLGQAYVLEDKKEKARALLQMFIRDHSSTPNPTRP